MEVVLLSPSWSLSGPPVLLELSDPQHATPPAPAAAAAPRYIQPAGLHRKSHRVYLQRKSSLSLETRARAGVWVGGRARERVQGSERGGGGGCKSSEP